MGDRSALDRVMRWNVGPGDVLTLTMDDPQRPVTTMTPSFWRDFESAIDHAEARSTALQGVVLTSAKKTFLAGGDLSALRAVEPHQRTQFVSGLEHRKSLLRRLERLPVPVVAVINGAALGGGLEIALACHRRVVVERGDVQLGCPEVTLGLLPGAGGITRLSALLGRARAYGIVATGDRLSASEAVARGIADVLASDEDEALRLAHDWIRSRPRPGQPWDGSNFEVSQEFQVPLSSAPTSAELAIRELVERTTERSFDESLRAESSALGQLVVSLETKAILDVLFFDTAAVRRRYRPDPSLAPRFVAGDGEVAAALAAAGLPPEFLSRIEEDSAVADSQMTVLGEGSSLQSERTDGPVVVLSRDWTSGGGWIAEVWARGAGVESHVADLARFGLLPVERTGEVVPLRQVGQQIVEHVSAAVQRGGVAAEEVATAVHRAGLQPIRVERQLPCSAAAATDPGELAVELLATAARMWLGADVVAHPGDLDLAAVRAGGFPAWTGGPRRYLQRPALTLTK